MFFTHTDAVVGDLAFTRTYHSARVANGTRYDAFGSGWNASFEARLVLRSGYPYSVEARTTEGSPQYYFDHDGDGVFQSVLPYSTESWVERTPTGYRRLFRAGGEENYNSTGKLLTVKERLGLTTTYTRDPQGRLSSVSRLGRGIKITYAGSATKPWKLFSLDDILLATYTYVAYRLDTVTYPDGSGYKYTYDEVVSPFRLLTVRDLEGKKIEAHTYEGNRAKTSELGDGQEKLTFTYQTNKTLVTDALGNVTTYEYVNKRGTRRVNKVIGPCSSCGGGGGNTQEWTYDDYERITSYKDGAGNLSTYTYDPATGDLLTETHKPDPSTTLVTTYTYHPDGRLKTRTDPRGGVTTWTYERIGDEEKETVSQTVNANQTRVTVIWYNNLGKPRLVIDPRQEESQLFYAPQGDLDYVVDPAGKETHFTYDSLGRRTQTINPSTTPAALEPKYEYSVRGRVRRVIDPTDQNKFTELTYDKGGRRKEVRDALQRRTEYIYDDYGRLQFVKRWLDATTNQTTEYHYDLMSKVDWIKDARGKQTTFVYDGHNRLWKVLYPPDATEQRVEEFTYDDAGRLETRKDRRGVITTYGYDGLGRLTGKSYAGGPVSTAAVTFGYDGAGNLILADDGSTTLSWTHNLTGEPESATQQQLVDGLTIATSLAYGYDDAGARTSLDTGLGFSLGYDYDVVGRPWHIVRGSETFTFGYDDASRRRSLTFPNGVVSSLTPDTLSRLDVLEVLSGTTSLNRFDYDYDDVGNRTRKATPTVSEDYTYDPVYQLDTVRRNTALTEDFGHDPVGNRNATLGLPSPSQWVHSNRNELLTSGSASFTYDLNGNVATKSDATGAWTYEWDAENRLTRVRRDGAEVARYRYDPFGRRIEKLLGTVRTTYVYDGEDILRERVESSNRYFVHGPSIDEPLARVAGSTVTYFHADGLGSIVSHTNAAGAVVYSRSYDAFGNLEAGAGEAGYSFTGREWDPETGLYYYRARYYDPKVGRFISEDPIGLRGGINLYAYVLNSPAMFADPFGLDIDFCYYADAAAGFGHMGFGVNGTPTSGFYPAGNPFGGPGKIQEDKQKLSKCKTAKTEANVDDCMQKCLDRAKKNPPYYSLKGFTRARDGVRGFNCASFVRSCMLICGMEPGEGDRYDPRDFFDHLPYERKEK